MSLQARMRRSAARVQRLRHDNAYFFHQSIAAPDDVWVDIDGQRMLMLSSYNYLSLQRSPEVISEVELQLKRFGTSAGGSPLLSGTTAAHLGLQSELAAFIGQDDAMLFSSGYVANLTTISTLVDRGDWVIADELNHASIMDGCRLSGATFKRYRHNDAAHLDETLAGAPSEATKLVIADGVFSMDGDILDLPSISAACRRHGALLMVDEAHSLGVLGPTGRGVEEHWGTRGLVDVHMGVLSKALPSSGGYVAASRALVDYLRHNAHGYIFSGSLSPASVAAARSALAVLEREPQRVTRLRQQSDGFRAALQARGLNTGTSLTPIVPIVVGDERNAHALARHMQHNGFFALAVVPPAVPNTTCRIRFCVNAGHAAVDLERAAETLRQGCLQLGIEASH